MILTELFFLVVYLSLVGGLFGVVSLLEFSDSKVRAAI